MTPSLFHGPEARNAALSLSESVGQPVSEPIGDSGLKVDDSRDIILLANSPGVGDRPPTLVIGPLDRATVEASDALLKTLEDLSSAPLRLILWAEFVSGVRRTIRSRSTEIWCPPTPRTPNPFSGLREPAEKLVEALFSEDPLRILGVLEDAGEKEWGDLVLAAIDPLSKRAQDAKAPAIWGRVRPLLRGNVSPLGIASALLPELE